MPTSTTTQANSDGGAGGASGAGANSSTLAAFGHQLLLQAPQFAFGQGGAVADGAANGAGSSSTSGGGGGGPLNFSPELINTSYLQNALTAAAAAAQNSGQAGGGGGSGGGGNGAAAAVGGAGDASAVFLPGENPDLPSAVSATATQVSNELNFFFRRTFSCF